MAASSMRTVLCAYLCTRNDLSDGSLIQNTANEESRTIKWHRRMDW